MPYKCNCKCLLHFFFIFHVKNFGGEGSLLGSLAKEKASKYRELKETTTGQSFLKANLAEMSKEPQEMTKNRKGLGLKEYFP